MRLVCDSSGDTYTREDIDYRYVPLSIICGNKVYEDRPELDPVQLMKDLKASKEKTSSSCPNVSHWLESFEGADEIFCVTITGGMSGSYSTALQAKDIYLEEHPNAKIHVFDSKGAGPSLTLISDYIAERIVAGKSFEQIVEETTEYCKKLKLVFSLHSVENLARNGRINPIIAKGIGILNIRITGEASPEGTLTPLKKCRNRKKEIELLIEHMIEHNYNGGRIVIHHGRNPEIEDTIAQIQEKFPGAPITVKLQCCLCSFYTEGESILLGYETH